jgi:hypothetical protein
LERHVRVKHKAPFVPDADEPAVLLGSDTGAGAAEYVLAALSACLTATLVYHGSARGLKIEDIQSEYEGDVDRGFLDLDPKVAMAAVEGDWICVLGSKQNER